jgi:hypothetical protein
VVHPARLGNPSVVRARRRDLEAEGLTSTIRAARLLNAPCPSSIRASRRAGGSSSA